MMVDEASDLGGARDAARGTAPRHSRRLSDKILIAFHHACEQGDFEVADAARRYRVYYAKARRSEMTDYLVDHSGFTYLVGPDGRVRTLFRPGTSPEAMAATVSAQLANRSAATN